jgi:ParB family transcriptional regulator, chromosome partitioning protein
VPQSGVPVNDGPVAPQEDTVPAVPSPELELEAPVVLPELDSAPIEPRQGGAAPVSRERTRHHDEKPYESVFHIEVEKITSNPQQPRRMFDEVGIKELAASIHEFGLLQPIVVSKIEREVPTGTEVTYQLVAGERRLLAARLLGLERIPAIIRNVNLERERLELAVIENIQREDLNPIETARAFARLQDEFRLTQREIAARLGKSREVIANSVRLLDLPTPIQEALEQGKISESHGRLLLTIDDPAIQTKLFDDLLANRMTTRDLRTRVDALKRSKKEPAEELPPELKMFREKLSAELGAPVSIHRSGETGKITITYYSDEELKSIVNRLAHGE